MSIFLFLLSLIGLVHAQEGEAPEEAEAAAEEAEAGDGSEEPTREYPKPEKVAVGIHVNDIQTIDLTTHTYVVDFWMWFRWQDPEIDPATSLEFVNPNDLWGQMITPNYEEPETLPDGSLYQVIRVQGKFSKKLPLYNYPFDRQVLEVVFEDSIDASQGLVYVGDPTSMDPDLILPGYTLGQPRLVIEEITHPTTFGDPREASASTYSRGRLEIPIGRPVAAYAAKLLLPVVCVVFCSALMFLLVPVYIDARVDVGITALLTIVALQITSNQDLPDVGYLMLMDKVYLLSYAFVLVGLGTVVRTARLINEQKAAEAAALQRKLTPLLVLAYTLVLALLVFQATEQG